jgi:hypothetical protein
MVSSTSELERAWASHRQALLAVQVLAEEADAAVQSCITALALYRQARGEMKAGPDIDYGELVRLMIEQEKLIKADY